jgi:hypothetical protein
VVAALGLVVLGVNKGTLVGSWELGVGSWELLYHRMLYHRVLYHRMGVGSCCTTVWELGSKSAFGQLANQWETRPKFAASGAPFQDSWELAP